MSIKLERSMAVWVVAIFAIMFGLLTLRSGAAVIFIDGVERQAAGNYVPFVVWFNFLAGFVYLIAGAGIWWLKPWAVRLSVFIAVLTLIVYAVLGLYILGGGLYEMRTIIAMSLRSIIWVSIAMFAYRKIIQNRDQN